MYNVLINLICDDCKIGITTRDYIALQTAIKAKGWKWGPVKALGDLRLLCPDCVEKEKKSEKEGNSDSALMKAFDVLLPVCENFLLDDYIPSDYPENDICGNCHCPRKKHGGKK